MQGESPLLFCAQSGDPPVQISRKLTDLAKLFGSIIPPATAVRKAIATAGGALKVEEKSALAHLMNQSTADAYYRVYSVAKSVEGFKAVGNLLEIPEGKKKRHVSRKSRPSSFAPTFPRISRREFSQAGRQLTPYWLRMRNSLRGGVGGISTRNGGT